MQTLTMVGLTAIFTLAIVYVVRPLLKHGIAIVMRQHNGQPGLNTLAILLAVLFLCAMATNLIGVFSIFGRLCWAPCCPTRRISRLGG